MLWVFIQPGFVNISDSGFNDSRVAVSSNKLHFFYKKLKIGVSQFLKISPFGGLLKLCHVRHKLFREDIIKNILLLPRTGSYKIDSA